jgi:hypothetical protein
VKNHQASRALDLLGLARVVHQVPCSAANGLPLGGEVKPTCIKTLLADIGLCHAVLDTPAATVFPEWSTFAPAVRGQLTDQMAGQQLRQLAHGSGDGPELYYWQREGGRPGEIDYLITCVGRILPIKLKSGTAGAMKMKSLHQFMYDKKLVHAVRCDANPPSIQEVQVTTTQGDPVRYSLVCVPL